MRRRKNNVNSVETGALNRRGVTDVEEGTINRQSGGVFKCLVYNGAVSLTLIDGGTFCAEGIKTHGLTGVAADAFASALLFAAFSGTELKEPSGEVSCTVKTDGALENLTVSCSAALDVRGCIDFSEKKGTGAFGQSGFLQVVKNDAYSRPFVGACALVYGEENYGEEKRGGRGGALRKEAENGLLSGADGSGVAINGAAEFFARNYEEYYRRSEQLSTAFVLRADAKRGAFYCAALQALPGDDGAWKSAAQTTLGALIQAYERENEKSGFFQAAERAAEEIFEETGCIERRRAAYRCSCSRGYLKGVLASLGKDELNAILNEQGRITAHCHYCNKDYVFLRGDVEDLL